MPRLPQIENQNVLTQAPQSSLSASDFSDPVKAWADVFGALGTKLSEHANEQAEMEGKNAVTLGADGQLKMAPNRFFGHQADIYEREAVVTLTTGQQSQLRRDTAAAAEESKGNVAAFDAWQKGYLPKFLKGVPQQTRNAFTLHAQDVLGQARAGVLGQGRDRDARIAVNTQKARFGELQQDLLTLARQGGTSSKAYQSTLGQLRSLGTEMVGNPDMAYGQGEFDIDMRSLASQAAGQATVGHIDSVLEKEGVPAALRAVKAIETDPALKGLSVTDRAQFASMGRQRIAEFKAFKEVENQPALAAKKDFEDFFSQGLALDDVKVDSLAAQLQKGGLASEAQELLDKRDRFRTIAALKTAPLPDAINATKGAMRRANGVAASPSRFTGDARTFLLARNKNHGEDHVDGMTPELQDGLAAMISAAPGDIGDGLEIMSGYRTVERQQELWEQSDKTGRTVARPGRSQHNHGRAADLTWNGQRLDKAPAHVREWVRDNAGRFGLVLPMSYEAWHVETADARGGGNAPSAARAQGMTRSMPGNVRASLSAAAQRYGQDANALLTIGWLESRGDANARNPSGAAGILQFMPSTALGYGLKNPYDVFRPDNPC